MTDCNIDKGKAVCDCKEPAKCLCKFLVTVDGKLITDQAKSTASIAPNIHIYLQDKDAKGVNVDIGLMPKGCVSKHPDCPNGVIYNSQEEDYELLGESGFLPLNTGINQLKLHWRGKKKIQATSYHDHIIYLLRTTVLGKLNEAPATTYDFVVNECVDKFSELQAGRVPFEELLATKDRSKPILLSPLTVIHGHFKVMPKMVWDVGLTLGLKSDVEALEEKQRKELLAKSTSKMLEQKEQEKLAKLSPDKREKYIAAQAQKQDSLTDKKKAKKENKLSKGWRKHTKEFSLKREMKLAGTANFTIGDDTRSYSATLLDKEFQTYKNKNKLSMLDNVEKVLSAPARLFKTEKSKIKSDAIDVKFLYPMIKLVGGGSLEVSKKTNQPYAKRELKIDFLPLLGIEVKVDLKDVFAKAYRVNHILDKIEATMKEQKTKYQEGDNAAFLEAELTLKLSTNIDLSLALESNEQEVYNFKFDATTFRLQIVGAANMRAGLRYEVFEGFFQVEANADMEGKIQADIMLDLDKVINSDRHSSIEATYYHKGVFAMVRGELNGDLGRKKKKKESKYGGTNRAPEDAETSASRSYGVAKKWVILDPLLKSDSTYKMQLFD